MSPPTRTLKEITIRFLHKGCWIQETSARHPEVVIVISSLYQTGTELVANLLLHGGTRAQRNEIRAEWGKDARIAKVAELSAGSRGERFQVTYTKKHSLYPAILRHHPLSVHGIMAAGGHEQFKVVGDSLDVERLVTALRKAGTVDILSVRNFKSDVDQLTGADAGTSPKLTEKQIQILAKSLADGYYDWPRRATPTELARDVGLGPSTFLYHLRHAEAVAVQEWLERLDEARKNGARRPAGQ